MGFFCRLTGAVLVAIVATKRYQYLHTHHPSSALNQPGRLRWKRLQSSAPDKELRISERPRRSLTHQAKNKRDP